MNAVLEPNRDAPPPNLVSSLQTRFSRQLRVQIADWQDTCRELAVWEDANLVEACMPGALAEHASMLDRLAEFGEWLAAALQAAGREAGALSDEVRMTMQDLRDARALWHGGIDAGRKSAILVDCFADRNS